MANIKTAYAGVAALTITLTSLASYASRQSTAVVNTTNLYLDYQLTGQIGMGTAVPNGDIHLLLYGSDGTFTSSPAGLVDAAITVPGINNLGGLTPGQFVPGTDLIYFARVNCVGLAAAAEAMFAYSGIANAFGLAQGGGNIPPQWGLVMVNCTGQALSATAGNHVINQNGLFDTSV